jgi:hypothetical protein
MVRLGLYELGMSSLYVYWSKAVRWFFSIHLILALAFEQI